MKVISWNIKGLGNPSENFSVKYVFRKYKADVIMLQETKKPFIDKKCFQSVWGGTNRELFFTSASGSAGGMMIAWEKVFLILFRLNMGSTLFWLTFWIGLRG